MASYMEEDFDDDLDVDEHDESYTVHEMIADDVENIFVGNVKKEAKPEVPLFILYSLPNEVTSKPLEKKKGRGIKLPEVSELPKSLDELYKFISAKNTYKATPKSRKQKTVIPKYCSSTKSQTVSSRCSALETTHLSQPTLKFPSQTNSKKSTATRTRHNLPTVSSGELGSCIGDLQASSTRTSKRHIAKKIKFSVPDVTYDKLHSCTDYNKATFTTNCQKPKAKDTMPSLTGVPFAKIGYCIENAQNSSAIEGQKLSKEALELSCIANNNFLAVNHNPRESTYVQDVSSAKLSLCIENSQASFQLQGQGNSERVLEPNCSKKSTSLGNDYKSLESTAASVYRLVSKYFQDVLSSQIDEYSAKSLIVTDGIIYQGSEKVVATEELVASEEVSPKISERMNINCKPKTDKGTPNWCKRKTANPANGYKFTQDIMKTEKLLNNHKAITGLQKRGRKKSNVANGFQLNQDTIKIDGGTSKLKAVKRKQNLSGRNNNASCSLQFIPETGELVSTMQTKGLINTAIKTEGLTNILMNNEELTTTAIKSEGFYSSIMKTEGLLSTTMKTEKLNKTLENEPLVNTPTAPKGNRKCRKIAIKAPSGQKATTNFGPANSLSKALKRKPKIKKCMTDPGSISTIEIKKEKIASPLNEHKFQRKLLPKVYNCEYCPSAFSRMDYLKLHIMHHTNEKPYICDVCRKGFRMRWRLKLHHATHFNEKPYHCRHCSYRAVRRDNLRVHIQKRHKHVTFCNMKECMLEHDHA